GVREGRGWFIRWRAGVACAVRVYARLGNHRQEGVEMRAAVSVDQDQPLIIAEMTPLDPGPGDVVVEIGASGVCHSDVSATNGTLPLPPPTILGHEGVGTVDGVGSEVSQAKKGDRVIGMFIPSCGACWYCTHDQSNLCEQTGPVMMTPRAQRPDGTPIPG